MAKVIQSNFEKAVIDAVKYLLKNKIAIGKFTHNYELLDELGLKATNWHQIMDAERNIARYKRDGDGGDQWELIRRVLVNKYGISNNFLDKNKGNMFSDDAAITLMEDVPPPYGRAEVRALGLLNKNIEVLNEVLERQRQAAKLLQEEIKKSAKNPAKS